MFWLISCITYNNNVYSMINKKINKISNKTKQTIITQSNIWERKTLVPAGEN